jgi:hypothetical protein
MRLLRFFAWASLAGALTVGPFACSSAAPATNTLAKKDSGEATDSGDNGGDDGGTTPTPPPPPPPGPATGQVYANTTDTLYLYEPFSRKLTVIGKFSCLQPGEAVIDIALDRTNEMYATTFGRFLHVVPTTAACTEVGTAPADMNYPNSLSFVPVGTVSASVETLVGYASPTGVDGENYVSIDVATGKMTSVGNLNGSGPIDGQWWASSGDLISLLRDGNKTYLTVHPQGDAGLTATDSLAEIDPTTGLLKRIIGDTKQAHIYGLGYWAGKAYGFSDDGRATEIDVNTGVGTVLLTLDDDAGAPMPWYGAGVTTNAPISP